MSLALALLLAAAPAADDVAALTDAKLTAWPRYYRENDADGLANFLADGFVALQPDGTTETKADAVAWVRGNKWTNAQRGFRYDIRDIAFYGPDIANVYGVGSFDGPSCRMAYSSANVFVRIGGRWRPKFSHLSKAECQAKAR